MARRMSDDNVFKMWVSSAGGVTRLEALWLLENTKAQVLCGDDDE